MKKKALYLLITLVIAATIIFFISKSKNQYPKFAKEAISVFYGGDLDSFKLYVSDSSTALIDSLFLADTLRFQNRYEIKGVEVLAKIGNEISTSILVNEDTVATVIRDTDSGLKLALTESGLLKMLQAEGAICFEVGKNLYEAGIHQQAKKWLLLSDSSKQAEAACYLGYIYHLERSWVEAYKYFKLSFEKGHFEAAVPYARAIFTETFDAEKARDVLKIGAENGDLLSMHQLARKYDMIINDNIIPPADYNDTIAEYWYHKAASLGHAWSMHDIGFRYEIMGNDYFYIFKYKDKTDLTQEQLLELAFKWYKKAANSGRSSSMVEVGLYMIKGIGTGQDIDGGIDWLKKAAKLGSSEAYYQYGLLLENGKYVDRDINEAIKHYRKAVELGGNILAKMRLEEIEDKETKEFKIGN